MPHEGYAEQVQALRHFIDKWSAKGNHFLVTCRVLDYRKELSGLQCIEVQPLSEEKIQEFLKKELLTNWQILWQQLVDGEAGQRLLEMAHNPYLLTMMIDIFIEDGQLGQNRVKLMDRFIQILIGWAKKKYPPNEWLEADVQREALSIMAFEMQTRVDSGTVVEMDKIKAVMPDKVQPDPKWPPRPAPPDQVLRLAANAHIIEIPTDRSSVRFHHQLLQEYFITKYFVGNETKGISKKLKGLIDNHLTDSRWREVFLLTTGSLDDADSFFAQFRQAIDGLIDDKTLVELLRWAEKKGARTETWLEPSTIRCIFLIYALDLHFNWKYNELQNIWEGWKVLEEYDHSIDEVRDFLIVQLSFCKIGGVPSEKN
jgi:predicted NACHT family NTPase